MATDNPTGDGDAVRLKLHEHHEDFLREALSSFKKGIERDLARNEVRPNRERLEQTVGAYERLLDGLMTGSVVPDPEVIQVATNLAEVTDTANAYQQAMLEHRACCALLGQLEEGSGR